MRSLFLGSIVLVTAAAALGQAPDPLGFQGYLTDSLGNPVTKEKGLGMTFTLYKGGTAVWSEAQSVEVVSGNFNVFLGAVTPMKTLAFDQQMELGIKIDSEVSEMTPRTRLATVAYARALPGLYTFQREDGSWKSQNMAGGNHGNVIGSGVTGATISGGGGFFLSTPVPNQVLGTFGTIGGGFSNTVEGFAATIGGGASNSAIGTVATIAGGEKNVSSGLGSTVGGGKRNTASGDSSAVAGGTSNKASGLAATVAGGFSNTADTSFAAVSGGESNTAGGHSAVVGGGNSNTASGKYAAVAGGQGNTAGGYASAVGGGDGNTAGNNHATVAGGSSNGAAASLSAIGGGFGNYTNSFATGATIPGGSYNFAGGDHSFSAGLNARAEHDGAFVWQDYSAFGGHNLASSTANEFSARASGGFRLLTASAPDMDEGVFADGGAVTVTASGAGDVEFTLQANGRQLVRVADSTETLWTLGPLYDKDHFSLFSHEVSSHLLTVHRTTGHAGFGVLPDISAPLILANGAYVSSGGAWTDASSRTLKEGFQPIDSADVLKRLAALPLSTWRYKAEPYVVHMGPVAEDFYDLFGLGADDAHIAALDGNGVALAAIQGLYELVQELQADNERMQELLTRAGLD